MRAPRNGYAIACAVWLCSLQAPADVVGWRGDGTGKYLEATGITQWSPESNVLWRTELPGPGNALPCVVGNRLFICAEPTTLICVDTDTGALLWQRTNNFVDIVSAEEGERVRQETEAAGALQGQLGQLQGEIWRLKQDLKDQPDDRELTDRLTAAEQRAAELWQELEPYRKAWYRWPETHPTTGYSTPTPVSDGHHVWVAYGTGMVACYDLEGNRLWARVVDKPNHGWGHSASPRLVGDTLIIHYVMVNALNKDTGETLWQTPCQEGWGTEAVTQVAGTDILITPRGDILRVSDGKVLAGRVANAEYSSPVVEDGVVYFADESGATAVRLGEAITGDRLPTEVIWKSQAQQGRVYASPVVHDGLMYVCHQQGLFTVLDTSDGDLVYSQRLRLGGGEAYPSVTLADGLLYVSSESGTTVVLEPGREFRLVATNRLEPFRASPVFVGDRLYIRGLQNLYCLRAQ